MVRTIMVMLLAAAVVYGGAGMSSYDYLKIGVGERACSMAGAFTGVSDDATAVYWNPAGACQLNSREITLGHTEYVADIKIADMAYLAPVGGKYVVGVGIENLYVEDWRRDNDGNVLGTFVNNETNVGLLLAYKVKNDISVGAVVRGIHEQLDDTRSSGVGIDLGVLYNISGINLGIVVKNAGASFDGAVMPTEVKIGLGYMGLAGGLISSDIELPVDGKKKLSIGGEYNVWKSLYLRAGYKLKEGGSDLGGLDGLNAGVGFNVSDYKINYGIAPYGDFGAIHRISLNRKF